MGGKEKQDALNRELCERVELRIQSDGLFGKEDTVLAALSGGADSVALLCILNDLGYNVWAYHLNHGLRGKEADRDELFCRRLCGKLGVPLYAEKIDVRGRAEDEGISFEDAGRKTRYEGLALVWRSLTAELDREAAECAFERGHPTRAGSSADGSGRPKVVVATGHHAGDVAETFVMNAMRGAGLTGLCSIAQSAARWVCVPSGVHTELESLLGMESEEKSDLPDPENGARAEEESSRGGYETKIRIVRPLLHMRKSELESYLVSRGTKWQSDSTNESEAYFRNRVRKYLDESAVRKILDCIELLKTDRDFLEMHTLDAISMHVYEKRCGVFERIGGEDALHSGAAAQVRHAAAAACVRKKNAPKRELLIRDCESLHPAIFSRLIRWVYGSLVGDLVNLTGKDVAAVMGLHRVGSELRIGSGERQVHIYRSYQGLEFSHSGRIPRHTSGHISAGMEARGHEEDAVSADEKNEEKASGEGAPEFGGGAKSGGCVGNDDRSKKSGEATKEVEAWEPLEDLREEPTLSVRMRRISGPEFAGVQMTDSQVAIDMGKVRGTLRIRSREEGDAFIPFGMKGRKTLKKLLIDEKIDRRLRSQLPIVVDDEKIVWVAGVRMSEEVRVSRGRTKVIGLLQLFDPRSS